MIRKNIEKKFPNLNYEYLCLNNIPRLRILFPKYNLSNIRENNKKILFNSFNKTKNIYSSVSFFSNNSKKINKKNFDNIYSAGLYWILNKGELCINHIEKNFFLHTYFLKLDINDIIYLSEIIIASNHLNGEKSNIPYIDGLFAYFFDLDSNFIINVYGFEGLDICSYNKNLLFDFKKIYNNEFKILDDKILSV